MSDFLFSVFPNENFVDLGLYQFGKEQCEPAHSFVCPLESFAMRRPVPDRT